MDSRLPFPALPRGKAALQAGIVYAIDGGDGHIFYGQVSRTSGIGFFRHRSTFLEPVEAVAAGVMSRFGVNRQSIGRAVRAGAWLKLGRFDLHPDLAQDPLLVQWPVGTLRVSVWQGDAVIRETMVHDPAIQALEVIASYDAIDHVPSRLRADFTQPNDAWKVGGTVWRERRLKEDLATRFPDMPSHKLPPGWLPTHDGV